MTAIQTSRTPLIVAALFALAEAARTAGVVDLALYGPDPRAVPGYGKALAVFADFPGASSRTPPLPGWDGVLYEQTVSVACSAFSYSGGGTVRQHNEAVYAIYDYLRTRIDGDPTLGGVCERAIMGPSEQAFPVADPLGVSVELKFAVVALAYI